MRNKSILFYFFVFKSRNHEQDREIHKLLDRISVLEDEKTKQSSRILKLKDEVEAVNGEVSKTRSSSDNAVTALSQELRQFKHDLERARQREKQVSKVVLIANF